ncbi:xanthine dehydrogenase small subunit [Knoellia aerolata]|uniref:Dehydrogenase n=1 Tax=Knoellia aerolata DSM 18566 TaxID=1385519 RepID=A0A0A0JYU8_9MICO|nr:FAD binding domain-containing protein [Knoellia aerolata]KGN42620.1 dehydrogenase [Knoellia aerolata DSM 18566]
MTRMSPAAATTAFLTVNGVSVPLGDSATPHTTTLDWLRDRGLTGSKEGCAEGECGACAVMVARAGTDGTATEWVAVNSCLVPVAALDGQEVVTVEGLGAPDRLHPVQQELADRGGSQCGYCTPGFVCSMAAEFYRAGRTAAGPEHASEPDVTADHEHGPNGFDLAALSGNLCRCTGYRPIRDAAYALGLPEESDPFAKRRLSAPTPARPTRLVADGAEFVRPSTLAETVQLLADHPDAVVLAGSTDVGVELNLKGSRPPLLVAVDRLPELRDLRVADDEVRIGAALTLTEIERGLGGRVPLLARLFPQFASPLIRNGATLGGNVGTASPIGDCAPALLALDASLVLSGPGGERVVALADYFTGYRESIRQPGELIREVRVPLPLSALVAFHKVAKRRFDDISSVAVAFALDVVDGTVTRARIGLGGVAATPIRALRTEAALEGARWTPETVTAAASVLATEGTPLSDHRASDRYRSAMLGQSLHRLYAEQGTISRVAP